jgi:hypothetical protein
MGSYGVFCVSSVSMGAPGGQRLFVASASGDAASKPPHPPCRALIVFSLPFAQPHPRASAAVLVDKYHARGL